MPVNQFKTDCGCDCSFEWWAAIKRVIYKLEQIQDAAEYAIGNQHFGKDSQRVMVGRNSVAVDIKRDLENIIDQV